VSGRVPVLGWARRHGLLGEPMSQNAIVVSGVPKPQIIYFSLLRSVPLPSARLGKCRVVLRGNPSCAHSPSRPLSAMDDVTAHLVVVTHCSSRAPADSSELRSGHRRPRIVQGTQAGLRDAVQEGVGAALVRRGSSCGNRSAQPCFLVPVATGVPWQVAHNAGARTRVAIDLSKQCEILDTLAHVFGDRETGFLLSSSGLLNTSRLL
jgi:hypothetical protein